MKNILITFLLVIAVGFTVNAQEISKNALGLRLGDNDGFGGEISYQARLSSSNRLELDLGWRDGKNYDGFKLTGLYQWVMPIENRFNWYLGLGGGVGSYDFKDDNNDNDNKDTFVFIAGDIGIEYNFSIPLLISLDFRPELGFGDSNFNNDGLDLDIALGLRYQF
ncbi:porin family protein [Nonlabens sp. Ci31]|jgi:opacity protein-like surface antigen|uniref:outer membrane beta-barrel protein n=1 Tax=Nonlabens sp. Ci31 TaxID=2608253 RepID=UPI001463B114|nr:outer membrane beta-barrel protein [Nonlabens sp. Ci31]QJP34358.1 porin family protein [Nonlabens sp. Ci31]